MSTTTSTDAQAFVSQAAEAALAVLPLPVPGTVTGVVDVADAPDLGDDGTAVTCRYAGAAGGTVTVIVDETTTEALLSSPEGALDPVDALRPALETAVATLGPCTLEQGVEGDPAGALAGLSGGAVAVVSAADGTVLALVGLTVSGEGAPAPASEAAVTATAGPRRTMDLLKDVQMDVTVELGRTTMTVQDLLSLSPGSVVELDRAAGSPADVLVNGQLIARGEVVVVDEDYAIRITEIVSPGAEVPA